MCVSEQYFAIFLTEVWHLNFGEQFHRQSESILQIRINRYIPISRWRWLNFQNICDVFHSITCRSAICTPLDRKSLRKTFSLISVRAWNNEKLIPNRRVVTHVRNSKSRYFKCLAKKLPKGYTSQKRITFRKSVMYIPVRQCISFQLSSIS